MEASKAAVVEAALVSWYGMSGVNRGADEEVLRDLGYEPPCELSDYIGEYTRMQSIRAQRAIAEIRDYLEKTAV